MSLAPKLLVIGFPVVEEILVPLLISNPLKCEGVITTPPLQFVEVDPAVKGVILTTARRKIKLCA